MKQSPNDLKQYQPLTLENGLRVLLVHNSETEKSAAALAVNVGHFSDPIERQGLAHFLEHMLFLGTEKYPDGSEYQKFISQYGGSNNAWTATEHTCFFFDIHHQHFEQGLDRFSQFFIAPLLSEEFVNKERKNIDAEFKLKLKDDIRRLYDVHKETINPAHPFAKFSVGNTETLDDRENENLRDTVAAFFHEHYRAKAMTLVIEGPQTLSELKQLVIDKFSAISDLAIEQPTDNIPLYLEEHQQIKIQVKPVKNDHQLIVSFAMPSIDNLYRSKPESLLAYLLGHEGPKSILSHLKGNQWALGLTAGSGINGYNFKDFNISIHLTELGTAHCEEIISTIFSYINLLKEKPLADYYYQEKKSIAELSFHYHEKMRPLDSVSQLVINMQHYPPEDYIFGDYVMAGVTNDSIAELLAYLTPDNMRIIEVNKAIETTKTSRWYNVPYHVSPISAVLLVKWKCIENNKSLSLPVKNNYIVDNPVVFPSTEDEKNDKKLKLPQHLENESGFSVWFKQDHTFKVPKGYIYIGIDSPTTIENNTHIAMTRLFVDLYSESVVEQHYDAELAGIHYHLYAHQGGMTLQLSGISDKQGLLLEKLLSELIQFNTNETQFLLFKQQLLTHWKNSDNSKSIAQLFSKLSSAMQPKNPSSEQLIAALTEISLKEFNHYCQRVFQNIAIEVFIHGNWRHQEAHKLKCIVKTAFSNQYHEKNIVKIPVLDIQGQSILDLPMFLPEHDHAAVIYYPMVERELNVIAKTMIVSQVLSPLFFQQMRTEKQYGYLVGVGFVPINRYPGIAFYIQSPNIEATELISAMTDFINQGYLALKEMDAKDWQYLQHGLAGQLQEKDTSLRIRSQRFWAAICNKETSFKQKQKLIETILALSQQEVETFISEQLSTQIAGIENKADRFNLMTFKESQVTGNILVDENFENCVKSITNKCSIKY
ncbi:insulinase family protein [bacterium]|nr:insulinase family protein [bacterium]